MTQIAIQERAARPYVTCLHLLLAPLLLVVGFGCTAPASAPAAAPPAPQSLRLLTGPGGGAYSPLGEALAAVYNRKLAGIHVTAESTDGPEGAASNPLALEEGTADLAFSRADLAFQRFSQAQQGGGGTSPLRSIAVLYTNVVHLLVRRGSGITRGQDMRGHVVQIGDESFGGALARTVIEGHGLQMSDVTTAGPSRTGMTKLRNGELDVRIFASAYPLSSIDDVGEGSRIALLSLSPEVVDRLRSRFPFFKPAVIPAGTYKGQKDDLATVGIDGLLLCRDGLPEDVVYQLTRTLFEAIPELSQTLNSARMISAANAPATPVPLHPVAVRYYRERDLFR